MLCEYMYYIFLYLCSVSVVYVSEKQSSVSLTQSPPISPRLSLHRDFGESNPYLKHRKKFPLSQDNTDQSSLSPRPWRCKTQLEEF